MGNTRSKNIVENAMNSMLQVVSEASSKSVSGCSGVNSFTLENCIIDHDLNVSQNNACNFDIKAFTENASSVSTENDLQNVAKQHSEAVSASFSLSSAESENVYKSMLNLATSIQVSASSDISSFASNMNSFVCKNSKIGGSAFVLQGNVSDLLSSMTTKNKGVIAAKQKLQSTLDQYSKASVSSWWLIIVAIVLLIIAVPMMGASSFLSSLLPLLTLIGGSIGSVYFVRDCASEKPWLCKRPRAYYAGTLFASLIIFSVISIYASKTHRNSK